MRAQAECKIEKNGDLLGLLSAFFVFNFSVGFLLFTTLPELISPLPLSFFFSSCVCR